MLLLQSIGLMGAVLVVAGLWTPVAGVLIVLVELCSAFSGNVESSLLLASVGAALAVLGPGCHSFDSKRYGRKRIDVSKRV